MYQATTLALRQQLLETAQRLHERGLNYGASGNCALRLPQGAGFLVTPSGIAADELSAESMVALNFAGQIIEPVALGVTPSSEWRLHSSILQARSDVAAVAHTHSLYATILACQRLAVPPFHYMIALAGGSNIRCAPYALFGSQQLADAAVLALEQRRACLLANHGLLALGVDLTAALQLAQEVENLCAQYVHIRQSGKPILLSHQQMAEVLERFKTYGRAHSTLADGAAAVSRQ